LRSLAAANMMCEHYGDRQPFSHVPTYTSTLFDSRITAFRRIVLPLARPGLAATAIFAVIVTYNEFLFALVLTSTPSAETMPVGAATLIGRISVDWGGMSAAGVVGAVPIVVPW